MPMATATAMPVQPIAVATVMPVQPMAVASAVPMAHTTVVTMQVPGAGSFLSFTRATTPPGMWFEELCNCCNDCCLCWASWCCTCITVPQLHERITGERGSCQKWSTILGSLLILASIFSTLGGVSPIMPVFQSLTRFIYAVIICFLLCTVRQKVRHGDNIPPGCCGDDLEDCCCSWWCWCCTVPQMFHHLGVGGNHPYGLYTLGAPTGSDVVPSDYGPTGPYGVPPLGSAAAPTASATGPSI